MVLVRCVRCFDSDNVNAPSAGHINLPQCRLLQHPNMRGASSCAPISQGSHTADKRTYIAIDSSTAVENPERLTSIRRPSCPCIEQEPPQTTFGGAHFARVAHIVEKDVAFNPADVGLLGAIGVVLEADGIPSASSGQART